MTIKAELRHANGTKIPDGLRLWLLRDPHMRGRGKATWASSRVTRPDELGDALDVLTLVVTSLLALPSAIESVRQWCSTRDAESPPIDLRVGEVTLTLTGTESPERIAAFVEAVSKAQPSPEQDIAPERD